MGRADDVGQGPAGRPVRGVVTGQFVAADGGCRGWGRYEGNVGQ